MIDSITDGIFVLNEYKIAITVLFVTIFGIGYQSTFFLNRDGEIKIKMLTSFGVGILLVSILSFVFVILSHLFDLSLQILGYSIVILSILVLLKGLWLGEFEKLLSLPVLITAFAFFLLLVARFGFLKYILLPPYSDSPVHYQIVHGFLHPEFDSTSKLSLKTIFTNYYHFGFHGLAAWMTAVAGFEPEMAISLVGQALLIIAPVSTISLLYTLTRNASGAMFAGLLSAIGWLMPAFAVNWGKFPALASIAILPTVASLILLLKNELRTAKNLSYGSILLIGIIFIHTRIVVSLFFFFISLLIVNKLQLEENFGIFRSIRFTLLFALFIWPMFRLVVDFYGNMPVLISLLVLIPFAFQVYPSIAVGAMIFLSGLSLATLIPNILNIGGLTLFDRQFVAMILYIPLSLMGGLGFGGLIKKLGARDFIKYTVALILVVCVFMNLTPQAFLPDRCCDYYGESDAFAFQWIRERSSLHTLYYISNINDGARFFGTDAGVWISPLTQAATNKLLYNIDWNDPTLFERVCPPENGIAYIYMGGRDLSFNNSRLAQLQWVTPAFQDGQVVIYRISNCMASTERERYL